MHSVLCCCRAETEVTGKGSVDIFPSDALKKHVMKQPQILWL